MMSTPRPIGVVPSRGEPCLTGAKFPPSVLADLLEVNDDAARMELPQIRKHLAQFGDRLPGELRAQLTRPELELSRAQT
jgi:phosphoenolpyruvate carboxykinase (GTP)